MTVYVIGIDGGRSTGMAEIARGKRSFYMQDEPDNVLTSLELRLAWHADEAHEPHTVLVAYEVYRQVGRAPVTRQPEAQDVARSVHDLAQRYGFPSVGQTPAEAKKIASDTFLRRAGLWTLPREVDQLDANDVNDAMRHAVLALARRHARLYEALLTRAFPR
jgi:hypothetical protein